MTTHKTRAQTAAATRLRVLSRARDLFVEQGFVATSTRQVASESGVTERTLFNIFGSKGELLRHVMLSQVFDEDTAPLLERQDFRRAREARSVGDFLVEFAVWIEHLHEHSAAVAEMLRAAAAADATAAGLWTWGNEQQATDCLSLIAELQERGWLRSDHPAPELAGTIAALSGHEVYWRLVVRGPLSPQAYRRWLARHCAVELGVSDPRTTVRRRTS